MKTINIHDEKRFNEFEELFAAMRAKTPADGQIVSVRGCVHRVRIMSDFSFVILRTARRLLQCVYIPAECAAPVEGLREGAFVRLDGRLKVEERSRIGYDFIITGYETLSVPSQELPFVLNKKELDIGLDAKLDYRPISMRHPKERAVFQVADAILTGFRKYFNTNGYTEIVAPKLVSAGAEGGADMFALRYFDKNAYLAQSPQFYKQMMVGVFERVFSVGPVFRAEKSHTSRHTTEFQGIDMEMGFIDGFEDVMLEEARALACVFSHLRESCPDELALLGAKLPTVDAVPQVRFDEVKQMVAKRYNRAFRSEDDLEPEEERLIGELFAKEYGSELVFITHYPAKKRPFYTMNDPADPRYTLSFDLLLGGTEITTGGQRIHEYGMQTAKMESLGMNVADFESFLMIHKFGMPPHGGLGIGLERLTMKLLGLDNIRNATLFPRDVDRLEP